MVLALLFWGALRRFAQPALGVSPYVESAGWQGRHCAYHLRCLSVLTFEGELKCIVVNGSR